MKRKYRCQRCGVKGSPVRWSKVFRGFVCVDRQECNSFLELGEIKKEQEKK